MNKDFSSWVEKYRPTNLNEISEIFKRFSDVKIGLEEFNYISTQKMHSYWIVTCTK
jgi:hypothetical protein